MAVLRLEDGSVLTLGAVLARAGEGVIYEVIGRPEWVVKVFHADLKDLAAKRAKVAAMIASPPPGAVQADGFVVLTWPRHLVSGDDGTVGYVMSRVDTSNAVEIHTLSNPADRMKPLPSAPQWTPHASWHHLITVAANLCVAVEAVHQVDAVIGDFQERNILVNDTTRVTLVDCDSIQFTDQSGHQYLCGVGRPEFTAPELAGVNLSSTARDKPSDLFALAVHIHLLLMAGNHPFLRGHWTGPGDQPDALALARSGQWAGGPGSSLRTYPLAPPLDSLPYAIQQLFIRAFTEGAYNPAARPSASEWRQALQAVVVTTCPRGHQIPTELESCPWCAIDGERAARRDQRARAAAPTISYPAYGSTSTPTPPTPRPVASPQAARGRTPLVVALVVVTVIAAVAIGFALLGRGHEPEKRAAGTTPAGGAGNTTSAVTQACTLTTLSGTGSATMTPDGLSVNTTLDSSCLSTDTLTGSSVLVTVTAGSRDVASGVFNLNAHPIAPASGESRQQRFVFPAGMYWRVPETIGNASLRVEVSGFTHTADGASGRSDPIVASVPSAPANGDVESTAAAALQELVDADYSFVKGNLADRWIPQISSKRVGLVTDGITYANADILRNHLELRQRYENVRLVFSGRWTTFNGDNWWVTVVGAPFGDAAAANGWCDAHGIDSWNCFAKTVSDSRGPEGTTVIRK
jgi:hypothetical protein